MLTRWVLGSIAVVTLLAACLSCEAIQKKLHDIQSAHGAAIVAGNNQAKPMMRDAEKPDGYEMITSYDAGGGKFDESLKGKKFKKCTPALYRVLPEPGEIIAHWAKEPIEQLIRDGKLKSDRYYALDHIGEGVGGGVFVSIPASERAEFVKNVEEGGGRICYWSDGQVDSLPSPKDSKPMYFVEVSKWDGVLKPHEPMDTGTPAGSPAGSAMP